MHDHLQVLIIATAITLLVVEILARPEPPVSQYLPPNQLYGPPQRPSLSNPIASPANFGINQYLPPNQQYGPPGAGSGGSGGYGEESYVSFSSNNSHTICNKKNKNSNINYFSPKKKIIYTKKQRFIQLDLISII